MLRLLRFGVFMLVMVLVSHTRADPDLWGHVRFGGDIAADGVVHHDSYSFTSDRPWINHEWLAELLMYDAYAFGGSAGLVFLKLMVVITTLLVILWSFRPLHLRPITHDLLVCLAVFGIFLRTLAVRPQVFSLLLFAVLLAVLVAANRGRPRLLVTVPFLMMVWVNLHGGWIVGLGIFGIWCTFHLVDPGVPPIGRRWLCGVAIASICATLINPYGLDLWMFLWQTVGFNRADVADWQPITKAAPGAIVPWAVTLVLAIVAVARNPRQKIVYVLLVALLALASVRVGRLDAFFTLAAVILLAPSFAASCQSSVLGPRSSVGVARSSVLGPRSSVTDRPASYRPRTADKLSRTAATVAVLIALTVSGTAALAIRTNVGCIAMKDSWLPETEAAQFIEANRLTGRMLTWFDWGQYAIWNFAPAVRVSMDGRRETVYTDSQVMSHYRFYHDAVEARDLPQRLNPDYIWLPKRLPVVTTLRDQGWRQIFEGSISTILAKKEGQNVSARVGASNGPRCFPDK